MPANTANIKAQTSFPTKNEFFAVSKHHFQVISRCLPICLGVVRVDWIVRLKGAPSVGYFQIWHGLALLYVTHAVILAVLTWISGQFDVFSLCLSHF